MVNPGDIVLQDRTRINKIDFQDVKKTRFSIVLFTYKNVSGTYACTVPLINQNKKSKKQKTSKNYCHVPFIITTDRKSDIAKLDSAYLYNADTIHPTGLTVSLDILIKLNEQILEVEDIDENLFEFISSEIKKSLKKLRKERKKITKVEKKEKKQKSLKLKKEYQKKKANKY